MTKQTEGGPGGRSKGELLVASYRAARISQRPALHVELRANREALRKSRLLRQIAKEPPAPVAPAAPEAIALETAPQPAKQTAVPAAAQGSSIFATFIGNADSNVVTPPSEPPAESPPQTDELSVQTALAPDARAAPAAATRPLSTIGFGPGMIIRLSQLGIETVADLATADAAWLRTALGDISRLINVDLWIASARNAASDAA